MPCPPIAVYRRMKQFYIPKQILPRYVPVADGLALSTRCAAAVISMLVGNAVCAGRQGDAVPASGFGRCHAPIMSGRGVGGFCQPWRSGAWHKGVRLEAMRRKSQHGRVAELL